MEDNVLIACANQDERDDLRAQLRSRNFGAGLVCSLEGVQKKGHKKNWLAFIIDLDSIVVDNQAIRRLAMNFPGTPVLCISSGRFHPELKDAICYHIYACINKPIDPDELFFLLKGIQEDAAGYLPP